MVMSVLRHLNVFKRACNVENQEWEEKHDPKILLDFKVGVSCLLFGIVAAALYAVGNTWGAFFFVVVTTFSTLADAVYVNHYYIDIADRIIACCGAFYMLWYCTQWFIAHQDWTQYLVWIKIITQAISGVTPLTYLEQCRAFAVRTENWREKHIMWHITGTSAMVLSIYVNHGYLDSTFDYLLDHLEPYIGRWIDVEPIYETLTYLQDVATNATVENLI